MKAALGEACMAFEQSRFTVGLIYQQTMFCSRYIQVIL